MPYFDTAQAWLTQSSLLLQARPTTTRITTTYTLESSDPVKQKKQRARKPREGSDAQAADAAAAGATSAPPPGPRATLTLKTYDPVSGVALKYKTDKAAEVGRLVLSMSRLGRTMAGLPELSEEDVVMGGLDGPAEAAEVASGTATPVPEVAKGGAGGAGGKKGKKKAKK